jgi:hypothetical protein
MLSLNLTAANAAVHPIAAQAVDALRPTDLLLDARARVDQIDALHQADLQPTAQTVAHRSVEVLLKDHLNVVHLVVDHLTVHRSVVQVQADRHQTDHRLVDPHLVVRDHRDRQLIVRMAINQEVIGLPMVQNALLSVTKQVDPIDLHSQNAVSRGTIKKDLTTANRSTEAVHHAQATATASLSTVVDRVTESHLVEVRLEVHLSVQNDHFVVMTVKDHLHHGSLEEVAYLQLKKAQLSQLVHEIQADSISHLKDHRVVISGIDHLAAIRAIDRPDAISETDRHVVTLVIVHHVVISATNLKLVIPAIDHRVVTSAIDRHEAVMVHRNRVCANHTIGRVHRVVQIADQIVSLHEAHSAVLAQHVKVVKKYQMFNTKHRVSSV